MWLTDCRINGFKVTRWYSRVTLTDYFNAVCSLQWSTARLLKGLFYYCKSEV